MTVKTFWFLATAADGINFWGGLQDGGSSPTAADPSGWQVGQAASARYSYMSALSQRSTGSFTTSSQLTAQPSTLRWDAWRTVAPITGNFAAGDWFIITRVRAESTATGQRGHFQTRVWASVNANGSSAREITSGVVAGNEYPAITAINTGYDAQTQWSAPAFSLNNEYLFFQQEWVIDVVGTSDFCDVWVRVGANSSITTSDFSLGNTLAATEGADTAALAGSVEWDASLASAESADVAALSGVVASPATIAVVEASDSAAWVGLLSAYGPLAAAEGVDVATSSVLVAWSASLAATDGGDSAIASCFVTWRATLAATDGADAASAVGSTKWLVTIAAADGPDAALFYAVEIDFSSLAAIEDPDTASFSVSRFNPWALIAVEDPDSAALAGLVAAFGPLSVGEGADSAALTGGIFGAGAIAAIEDADSAAFAGLAVTAVSFAVVENIDTAFCLGTAALDVALVVLEAPDNFGGVALLPSFGPLVVVEAPDQASVAVMTGAVWPRNAIDVVAVEDFDAAAIQVAAGPIGNLEYQGVGGKLLYTASSPLERALADVEVAHMMATPARLITENLDPWEVESRNLVFLAYGMGVTLWEPAWSDTTRREWVANQWLFKQGVGSLPAYRMALDASEYDITDYITPPGGFFVSRDLTVEETNDWLRRMPQIRIKFASKTGVDLEMFASPDGGALATVGPNGPIPEIPGADVSFWFDAFLGIDDGRALYGNIAVLRYGDGHEVPLEMWDRVDTSKNVNEQVFEQLSVPAFLPTAFFLGEDFLEDDGNYVSHDDGEGRIYSFIVPEVVNVSTSEFAMTPLVPGLEPLSPRYEINSDVEYDLIPSAFANDWTLDVEYLTPDDGGLLLAHQMYLLDPSVSAAMNEGISFVDDARIGIPSDYAELAIDTHTLLPENTFILNDSWMDDGYAAPEDLTDFDRACRAVVAAKALRDTILVCFEPFVDSEGFKSSTSEESGQYALAPMVEEQDAVSANCTAFWSATLVASDTGDLAFFPGGTGGVMALLATETSDALAWDGTVPVTITYASLIAPLPTSDPLAVGALWLDGGEVAISGWASSLILLPTSPPSFPALWNNSGFLDISDFTDPSIPLPSTLPGASGQFWNNAGRVSGT